MAEIHRQLVFDAGIEQIIEFGEITPSHLPDIAQFVPGEGVIHQQLDEVLFPPTVEQSMIESLRPTVQTRELLTPRGFHGAHSESLEELSNAIAELTDQNEKEALENLTELLKEGTQLYSLLNAYRYLLQQA